MRITLEEYMSFDLLTTVESGGCSAKLSAKELAEILSSLPKPEHPDLIVDIETHDDAGVFRISSDTALVQTVDFFPPVCSDPYDFGQIAAANALSDVYAMGGRPLTAMNLMMFPSKKIPLNVFTEILRGGFDKVTESGAVIVGGHTIDDYPPKYGLSVTGIVHPEKITTNRGARDGDALILTKPIGTGTLIAGWKTRIASAKNYEEAITSMKTLNRIASEVMIRHGVIAATDITGFGLAGHAIKCAMASNVTMIIEAPRVPLLPGAYELSDQGCIPGATFRNLEFAETLCAFDLDDHARKMLLLDAQTSGGLLICVPGHAKETVLADLHREGVAHATIIGHVVQKGEKPLIIRG
jgi:selenide,water dikinase